MLQACEEQTEQWDWRKPLQAVEALLGHKQDARSTMSPLVLHGLIDMLPLTQHFPEDRWISIETRAGICSIVAWAHILLGLSVLVRFGSKGEEDAIRFPSHHAGNEHVLIDIPDFSPSREDLITLLSTAAREELFRLKAGVDEDKISQTSRSPARGLAWDILDGPASQLEGREIVIEEMSYLSCSLALHTSEHLCVVPVGPPTEGIGFLPCPIDRKRVFQAARLLFDVSDRKLSLRQIEKYETIIANGNLDRFESYPSSIRPILKKMENKDRFRLAAAPWRC